MPLIAFTPADVLRNKVLDAGWYGAKIIKVGDWKPSNDASSHNMLITFLIDKSEGKEIDRMFNSKAISMMPPLIAAAIGIVLKPESFNFNTDDLLGKEVDVNLVHKEYQGKISNDIADYLPYGRSQSGPSF